MIHASSYRSTPKLDTIANSQQVVLHEVTCNQTVDFAHHDEFSNSFASNCCDSNHGLNFMYNQMNYDQSQYTHCKSGANAVQLVQTYCPMLLPPFANEHGQNRNHQVDVSMAHYCYLYYQLHHMNP